MRLPRAPAGTARLLTLLLPQVVLAATALAATDRQLRTVALPPERVLSVAITIGTVRIEGWDRADAEIEVERHAPSSDALARAPLAIDETPEGVSVRALQADGATDPAIRAEVTVRVPRTATIERVQVMEGRVTIAGFRGRLTAEIQRGPIEGSDVSGALRLETGIGSIVLRRARLSADGLLRLRAFNGDVRLTLAERPADARILALAVNGAMHSEIPLTRRESWGPRWGEATLGRGEPVISIDVITGTIEIRSP